MAVYTVDLDQHDENGGKVRVVRKSNRTWECLGFPRSLLDAVRDSDNEDRSGVYILWGYEADQSKPRVYVGQSDGVFNRLGNHEGTGEKEFWVHTILFTSKDQDLHTTHVRYLEAELVKLARRNKRIVLMNATNPRTALLSGAVLDEVKEYFSDLLDCFAVLGIDFFEELDNLTSDIGIHAGDSKTSGGVDTEPTEEVKTPVYEPLLFHIKRKGGRSSRWGEGIEACGYEEGSKFVVKAGSQAAKTLTRSALTSPLHKHILEWRDKIIYGYEDDEGNSVGPALEDKGTHYEFVRDFTFESPSAASCQILGASSNGNEVWKGKDGRPLVEIRRSKTPNLGQKATIKTEETSIYHQHYLFLAHKGIKARGYLSLNGFVVSKGSQAVNDEALTNSTPTSSKEKRREFIGDGTMKLDGSIYVFTKDGTFNSPSQAADALAGGSYNGRKYWKDTEGRTLDEILKS